MYMHIVGHPPYVHVHFIHVNTCISIGQRAQRFLKIHQNGQKPVAVTALFQLHNDNSLAHAALYA